MIHAWPKLALGCHSSCDLQPGAGVAAPAEGSKAELKPHRGLGKSITACRKPDGSGSAPVAGALHDIWPISIV